jgi:hypothetical protein
LQTFIGQLLLDESLPASLGVSFLLLGLFAMALSAMSSMFSANAETHPMHRLATVEEVAGAVAFLAGPA